MVMVMQWLILCLLFFVTVISHQPDPIVKNTVDVEVDNQGSSHDQTEHPSLQTLESLERFLTSKSTTDSKHPICDELTWGSVLTDDEILDRIEAMIPEFVHKGLEPAIPVFNLKTYRSLPLSDCNVQASGQLTFQIDVPVKAKNQDYQLFNFPKGSFSFEADDGICYFEYPTKGIVEATAGDSIIPLSEAEWDNCVKMSICQVPSSQDVDLGDLVCLQAVFKGKVGRELAPFCKFHCQPHPHKNKRQVLAESFLFSWILK